MKYQKETSFLDAKRYARNKSKEQPGIVWVAAMAVRMLDEAFCGFALPEKDWTNKVIDGEVIPHLVMMFRDGKQI